MNIDAENGDILFQKLIDNKTIEPIGQEAELETSIQESFDDKDFSRIKINPEDVKLALKLMKEAGIDTNYTVS